jgi:2'-5' RNA ligase
MTEKSTMRCFVAIDLPQSLKDQLNSLIEGLKQADKGRKARWVRPDGIHLTLKFLGEVAPEKIPEIIAGTIEALSQPEIEPFNLLVGKLGVFPNLNAPRVMWVGVDGNLKALDQLQKAVEKALNPLGFPTEARPFSPHLTIGRVPDIGPEEKRKLGLLIQNYQGQTNFGAFQVEEAVLMQSEVRPEGAIYTLLQNFEF